MELTEQDLIQLKVRGITLETFQNQIDRFISGFPWARLDRPAIPGDGIFVFSEGELNQHVETFERLAPAEEPVRFVPASGAASRMFKHLFEFREKYLPGPEGDDLFSRDQGFNSVPYLLNHLRETAFSDALENVLRDRHQAGIDELMEQKDYGALLDGILSPSGLDYAQLPKALILFHRYPEGSRTSAAEHLAEAAHVALDDKRVARIHFTLSPEHRSRFLAHLEEVVPALERQLGVRFSISLSEQRPSTDTVAVDEQNRPFRNPDGSLHFRPGGHGALLCNLNDLGSGLIFVKNIDNIVPDRLKPDTYLYKKALGGYLLMLKQRIHAFLGKAESGEAGETDVTEMSAFLNERLFASVPAGFRQLPLQQQLNRLSALLNRPIRVCGMVRNEGEPGGGPFWVKDDSGDCSLQIIESSQVNASDPDQKKILSSSTHFNPVDLVCCIRDFKGETFALDRFTDPSTGFITTKSSGGKMLKAQELPGLWNGAMARWITAFVEVPVSTFNPVKTVNDLLRREHGSEVRS